MGEPTVPGSTCRDHRFTIGKVSFALGTLLIGLWMMAADLVPIAGGASDDRAFGAFYGPHLDEGRKPFLDVRSLRTIHIFGGALTGLVLVVCSPLCFVSRRSCRGLMMGCAVIVLSLVAMKVMLILLGIIQFAWQLPVAFKVEIFWESFVEKIPSLVYGIAVFSWAHSHPKCNGSDKKQDIDDGLR